MPMNEYLQENPRVIFIDVTFEVPTVDNDAGRYPHVLQERSGGVVRRA